jgi:CDP-diacylglycerol--serine O-phosphatidyltransferase
MDENKDTEKKTTKVSAVFRNSPNLVRNRLKGKAFLVPSFVTVVAFFSGFLAILSTFKGDFEYASKCIAAAIIFDGLDGRIARRLNATSAFGREFDSLSDVVSFGVAPGILLYCWGFLSLADEIGVPLCFLFIVCSGARLARFNIQAEDGEPKKHFQGLPTPGAAAAIAAIAYYHPAPLHDTPIVTILALYTATLSILMVSNLPFLSVKQIKLPRRHNRRNLLILSLAVALTWYSTKLVILLGCLGYVSTGFIINFLQQRELKKSLTH